MKNRIERAIFTNDTKDIGLSFDRIYWGSEFCENLITPLQILKKSYCLAKSKNKQFTLVTPYVTNYGLRKIKPLLRFLNNQENIEVVFNDWGVFKLLKDNFSNLKPVLGRLLTKQRRDPRALKILTNKQKPIERYLKEDGKRIILIPKNVPKSLFDHFQASVINARIFQTYLLSQNVKRFEIDNLVWKMNVKVNKEIGVSIYLPFGYISTTRMCGKLTLSYGPCKKECKNYFLKLKNNDLPVPIYSIGNTLFYRSCMPTQSYLKKQGIDRIIYQPRLPF